MKPLRDTIRSEAFTWGTFLYLFLISLVRESPYWMHGVPLLWQAGLGLALLPIIPGLLARNPRWILRGLLVTCFTPFQSGILAALALGAASLLILSRRELPRRSESSSQPVPLITVAALYAVFVGVRIAVEWGSVHTFLSSGFALTVQLLPIGAALVAGRAARIDGPDTIRDLLRVFGSHAAVLFLYPVVVGHPQLLLSVINGVLKPVYSLFGLPWTYPWYDPDWNPGSVSIVNYSGVLMAMAAVIMFGRVIRTRRIADGLGTVIFALAAFMAENAMAIAAAGGALCASFSAVAAANAARRMGAMPRFIAGAMAVSAVLFLFLVVTYLPGGRYDSTHKGHYFALQWSNISERPLRFIFGYGPGAYGSRISYLRLPEDPYSNAAILRSAYGAALPAASLPANEFTDDFHQISQAPAAWVSESQGLIVSGLIALYAENGLLGVLLLLSAVVLFFRSSRSTYRIQSTPRPIGWSAALERLFALVFLVFLSVFYNYTEIPCIMFLAVFLACVPGQGRDRK